MAAHPMHQMRTTAIAGLALLGLGLWGAWRGEATVNAMQGENMYQGTAPELRVTFSYPDHWPLHEERGTVESYQAVRIMAPRNAGSTYTSHLSVSGAPLKSQGGTFENAEERLEQYKRNLPPDAKILAEAPRQVGELTATELLVSYTLPAIHHKGLKAVPVPIKERKVVIAHGRYLY